MRKFAEINPGPGHGQHAITFSHLNIDPDIGPAQHGIRIDIELNRLLAGNGCKEPGVFGHRRIHDLSDATARKIVVTVVVVVVA